MPPAHTNNRHDSSFIHGAAATLGVLGILASIFVGGYWAIALGVVGAIMATFPAGKHPATRIHVPAFALSLLAVVLGIGAIAFGVIAHTWR